MLLNNGDVLRLFLTGPPLQNSNNACLLNTNLNKQCSNCYTQRACIQPDVFLIILLVWYFYLPPKLLSCLNHSSMTSQNVAAITGACTKFWSCEKFLEMNMQLCFNLYLGVTKHRTNLLHYC